MKGFLGFFFATFLAWAAFFGLLYFFSEGDDGLPKDPNAVVSEEGLTEEEMAKLEASSDNEILDSVGDVVENVAEAAKEGASSVTEEISDAIALSKPVEDPGYMTASKESDLREGMEYSEVARLIGSEGRKIHEAAPPLFQMLLIFCKNGFTNFCKRLLPSGRNLRIKQRK